MKKFLLPVLCLSISQAYAECDEPIVTVKVNGVETDKTVLYLDADDVVETGAYGINEQGCSFYFTYGKWFDDNGLLLSSGCEFESAKYEGTLYFSKEGRFTVKNNTIIIHRSVLTTGTIIRIDPRQVQGYGCGNKPHIEHLEMAVEELTAIELLPETQPVLPIATAQPGESMHEATSIYPNPAANYINIQLNTGATTLQGQVQVFSSNGQLVLEQRISSTTTTLDIANLQSGMYFAVISTDAGLIRKERFLKG